MVFPWVRSQIRQFLSRQSIRFVLESLGVTHGAAVRVTVAKLKASGAKSPFTKLSMLLKKNCDATTSYSWMGLLVGVDEQGTNMTVGTVARLTLLMNRPFVWCTKSPCSCKHNHTVRGGRRWPFLGGQRWVSHSPFMNTTASTQL